MTASVFEVIPIPSPVLYHLSLLMIGVSCAAVRRLSTETALELKLLFEKWRLLLAELVF
jgi:hypothetical protein